MVTSGYTAAREVGPGRSREDGQASEIIFVEASIVIDGGGEEGHEKTTLSSDGKTMTIDGMMGSIASHLVFDRVK